MVNQTTDINSLELKHQEECRAIISNKTACSGKVWTFLRIGTSYDFKDVCTRIFEWDGEFNTAGELEY